MKNLAESSVAALPQPPPDAALMSASEYQLWRLSLNASRRGPSELNTPHAQEIDEAWAFIVNGADELTVDHMKAAADALLGQAQYSQQSLLDAIRAINHNRRARHLTATKQEFITFVRSTLNSQLDADDAMTMLREQQASSALHHPSQLDPASISGREAAAVKPLDMVSVGSLKLADFFFAFRRRAIMQQYIGPDGRGGAAVGKKPSIPSSSNSSSAMQPKANEPAPPRKAPLPTLNRASEPKSPKQGGSGSSGDRQRSSFSLPASTDPIPISPDHVSQDSNAINSSQGQFQGKGKGGQVIKDRGQMEGSSRGVHSLPKIQDSSDFDRRRSAGALPGSNNNNFKRFVTMTDLMNEMGKINLGSRSHGSDRGVSCSLISENGEVEEENVFLPHILLESADEITNLQQLRKAVLNASKRRSAASFSHSPASTTHAPPPPEGQTSASGGLSSPVGQHLHHLPTKECSLPAILIGSQSQGGGRESGHSNEDVTGVQTRSRSGSGTLDLGSSSSPPRKKREGLSNLSLKPPSALGKPPVRQQSEADLSLMKAIYRNKRQSSMGNNSPLFEELKESGPTVKFPREHFDVLTAGAAPIMIHPGNNSYQSGNREQNMRGVSFSGPSNSRGASMLSATGRKVSISSGYWDDDNEDDDA